VRLASKKFNSVKNDFSLVFEKTSQIKEVYNDDEAFKVPAKVLPSAPSVPDFQPIRSLSTLSAGSVASLLGVVV